MITEAIENLKKNSSLAVIDPQTQMSQWAINKITGVGAGEVNKILQNNDLFQKVMSFSKILKDVNIYISDVDSSAVDISFNNLYKFPITPDVIYVSDDITTEKIETIVGIMNYVKNKELKIIEFSSFFPGTYYEFSNDYSLFDISCVNHIENIRNKEIPIKLVITGIGISMLAYVTTFEKNTTSEGDIEYRIVFEQARNPEILELNLDINNKFKPEKFLSQKEFT